MKRKTLNKSTLLTPIAAAVLGLVAHQAVFAQQSDPNEVVVTGSQIRGIKPIGAAVSSIGRDDVEAAGAVSTAQIIQQLPQVFNLGVSENSRGQSGGSGNITYGSAINLRGIGPYSTLVLVNGHRVVAQGTSGAAVDPSIIPSLALERVEIVADGASALYGSDAIAGVANLITRRNETGMQVLVREGFGDKYRERQAGFMGGKKWEDGSATFAFENTFRSALSGKDRDFFRADQRGMGGGDYRSTQCAPGNIVISGVNYAIPAGGVTVANASSLVANTANRCDNLMVQDLIPRQERNSAIFNLNQKINDRVSLWADGFATKRTYEYHPGALSGNYTVPSTNPFYVRPVGAPAGSSETVAYSFINELPVNTATGYSRSWEGTLGFDVKMDHGWKTTVFYTHGDNFDQAASYGGINSAAVTAALADKNPATALNLFGGPNNPATLSTLNTSIGLSPGHTVFKDAMVKADGPVFDAPGGKARVAVGVERQSTTATGGQTTGTLAAPVFGEITLARTVDSAYGEMALPLVGASNAMAGVRALSVTAAVRTDRYSDVGGTSNPKFGLNWAPSDDLTLRGSYGTSFRAPGLTQIRGFSNGGRGGLYVQNYSDPTLNGANRVGVALSGGNPDLKPETATTKTLGFDWNLPVGDKSKLSMTWFDIDYENQIVGYLSDLTILNREAAFSGTNVIQRNPSSALVQQLIANYPVSGVLPSTWTLFVDGRNQNLSKSKSQGFDFQGSTRVRTSGMGDFLLSASGTVFTKYMVAATPASAMVNQLNTIFNPLKYRARFSTLWANGPWQGNAVLNYTGSYDNTLITPVQRVNANATLDLRLAYNFESSAPVDILKDTVLAVGVTNVTDKKPPYVNMAQGSNGGGGFDPTNANPIGRLVSLSLNKRF